MIPFSPLRWKSRRESPFFELADVTSNQLQQKTQKGAREHLDAVLHIHLCLTDYQMCVCVCVCVEFIEEGKHKKGMRAEDFKKEYVSFRVSS